MGIRHIVVLLLSFSIASIGMFSFSEIAFGQVEEPITVTTDKDSYVMGDTIRISGFFIPQATYYPVDITLLIQDSIGNIVIHDKLTPNSDDTFQTSYVASGSLWQETGEYTIKANYISQTAKTTFFLTGGIDSSTTQSLEPKVPDWVKKTAGWWSDGLVQDSEFIDAIEFLILNEIMVIPKSDLVKTDALPGIPNWIKDTAGWWAAGEVTDSDFVYGMQYLISKGIIQISQVTKIDWGVMSLPCCNDMPHEISMDPQGDCVIQTDLKSLFPTREQAGDMYRPDDYLYARHNGSMVFDGEIYKIHRKMYEKGIKIEINLIKFESCEDALTYLLSEREANLREGTIEDFEHNVKDVTECFGERWPLKYVHTVLVKCVKDNVYFTSSFAREAANDLPSVIRFAQYTADNFE